MKTWMRFGIGVAALALAVAVGTGAYAMHGNDESQRESLQAPESGDQPIPPVDGGLAASCLAGTPDCNDTPGVAYDDFGDASAKCAADTVDCVEPVCSPDGCTAESYAECPIRETDPPNASCQPWDCGAPAPGTEPAVEPPSVEPAGPTLVDPPIEGEGGITLVAPLPEVEGGAVVTGCLGEDPCAISSHPVVECLPPDCAVSSDGSIFCPTVPPCDLTEPGPGETDIKPLPAEMPCAISPCLANDPFAGVPESCPSPPCTVYRNDAPLGVPCDDIQTCVFPEPAVGAPEGVLDECPPTTDPGSGGGTGSSEGNEGSLPVVPAHEGAE